MRALYDTIGETYTATRGADPRIVSRLQEMLKLPVGASILDVGAGTGNYSVAMAERGFCVSALEPSQVMRAQGLQHEQLRWFEGVAELLPFRDGEFDGIIMTLCMHHFTDWPLALKEAARVVDQGPIVVFTFDADFHSHFWLLDYFPEFREKDKQWFPKIGALKACANSELDRSLDAHPFPIPPDLVDHFLAAGWARPEVYLQASYRAGISSFATLPEATLAPALEKLSNDLRTGEWDRTYGHHRSATELDVGYVFLEIRNAR